MKKLYLDCDGVILDTIDKALELMRKDNLNTSDSDLVHEYFVNSDWIKLIREAGVLNNSIDKIRHLMELGIYDIKILTTCVNKDEPFIKTAYFEIMLPEIPVITVPWLVRKDSVVDARNSILVDDSRTNIRNWREAGGVGIHFVKNNPNFDQMETNDLLEVPKFDTKVKKLVKF